MDHDRSFDLREIHRGQQLFTSDGPLETPRRGFPTHDRARIALYIGRDNVGMNVDGVTWSRHRLWRRTPAHSARSYLGWTLQSSSRSRWSLDRSFVSFDLLKRA